MKKHSGLYSAVSILLVIVLIAGISLSLLSSGRTRPDNPISTQPDRLQAESLQGSGSTGGQSSGKDNTENTDTAQDPSEPQKPDTTQEGLNLYFAPKQVQSQSQENAFDFSNVNENAKPKPQREDKKEDNALDFSSVDEAPKPDADDEDISGFDFSSLDPEKLNQTDEERMEAMRKFYLEKIRRMVMKKSTADNYQLWYELLNSHDFSRLAADEDFRLEATSLLYRTTYTKEVANLIAYCFGHGASYICVNSISNEWQVRLITPKALRRRTRFISESPSNMPKWVGVAAVIIAIMLFIVWPMSILASDNSSSNRMPEYTPQEQAHDPDEYLIDAFVDAANDHSYDLETLYPMCVGKWENEQGYIIIDESYGYALCFNGDTAAGSVSAVPAEKGTTVYASLTSDNPKYDGTLLGIVLISKDGKSLSVIFPDKTTTVMYKADEAETEVTTAQTEETQAETSQTEDEGISESYDIDGFSVTVTAYKNKPYTDIDMTNTSDKPSLSAPKVLYENRFFAGCTEAMLYYPSGMCERVPINDGIPDTQSNEVYLPVLWEDTDKYRQDDITSLRRVEPGETMSARCIFEK